MNFVTYFNYRYLPQGINLIRSIDTHCPNSKIFVFALDKLTHRSLQELNFDSVVLYQIHDLMNSDLQTAKSNRNDREFIWTLTPFCISKAFELSNEDNIIYIDADMAFIKEPKKIKNFQILNKDKIILTPHYFDKNKSSNITKHGYFCVQFMNFNKYLHCDVLNYWQSRVLESCSDKGTNGVFGDQKYIEKINKIFSELVVEYPDDSSFGAPWNMNKIIEGELEIYHFHSFSYIKEQKFKFFNHAYKLPSKYVKKTYYNYMEDYLTSIGMLTDLGFSDMNKEIFYNKRNAKIKLLDFINRTNIGIFE